MAHYPIPAATVEFAEEIKKSRFITLLAHTPGSEQARAFVQAVKAAHPQARHHCWAFVAGAPTDSQQLGFSDDGEPAGTAGKPILNCLLGSGVGELTAVVVRYYGGIRLGTGGLVRAYGNGVQQALKLLTTVDKVERQAFYLTCDYAQLSLVETLLAAYDGEKQEVEFGGNIRLRIGLPAEQVTLFAQALQDRTRGGLILQTLSE
ncbi:IMPACT family protein [Plesiomonas shigelloides]|uniref:IMPACT family protein n=1 Tax=Plesiomonas shigelloides TaxID=703 RepID=UPI001262688E|nr:IMPACT family protein [Plesiomonas shigelloides]KAB7690266.1 IMPACT family protein [Plesiomonas shigelloides]